MINLVLRNLISNAIKFTPEEGLISIDAIQKKDHIEISVADNGMGIKPEILADLFANKFISTSGTSREAGSGLGLMLCKDFLRKNGGDIAVQSELGKGSVFSFTLPSCN
jgi:signal transduction histidine kinase